MSYRQAAALVVLASLTGCSNLYKTTNKNETNIAGAGDLFKENTPFSSLSLSETEAGFTELDYCELIRQHSHGIVASTAQKESTESTESKESKKNCAIPAALSAVQYAKARNEIQDYVLAASNQKCGHYMRVLYGHRGDTEVFWGGLSTLLAGAGAVLTNVQSAQALSAGAAVSSGIRSELSQAYFANLAMEVITAGIHTRRAEILTKIKEDRKAENSSYTIPGAVGDALRYHAACSVLVGLEVASQAIERVNNPGVDDVLTHYDKLEKAFGRKKEEPQARQTDGKSQEETTTSAAGN